jgi:hypothetical protein
MNTTRKYSRTMEEAFGPGHRGGIYTTPEHIHPHDKIVLWFSAAAGLGFLAILIWS